ncbi:MAG: NAD(P)H-dependent glycerol-3-phosphate dehydrogenase [Holosporaceae bacterium]|jgi:glycerol-3-phosphate dehydrogenase (NAD(P)+)|nr:NAD(P)H-dependent glycerol-3-phosphate dehydrogenase [Holosporaceae bacterium]
MRVFSKIGVVGAGSYGLAITQYFSRKVQEVILIGNGVTSREEVDQLYSSTIVSGETLRANVSYVNDFCRAQECELIFIAVPAAAVLDVCEKIREADVKAPIVSCSKGFDMANGRLLSVSMEKILTNDIIIFSGPSFASEVARGLPAGVNIAGKNRELAQEISLAFSSDSFRIETLNDYISLQVAGAMKNALAVGCGIVSGLKYGESGIALLIVDGLKEMIALSMSLGGRQESFFELCGVGDVVLTCTSKQSRNVIFGEYIAGGGDMNNRNGNLAEGTFTIGAIPLLEKNSNVKLPLFSELHKVVYERKSFCYFSSLYQ